MGVCFLSTNKGFVFNVSRHCVLIGRRWNLKSEWAGARAGATGRECDVATRSTARCKSSETQEAVERREGSRFCCSRKKTRRKVLWWSCALDEETVLTAVRRWNESFWRKESTTEQISVRRAMVDLGPDVIFDERKDGDWATAACAHVRG